jgi:hypothetical protein
MAAGTLHLQIDDFGFAEPAAALEPELKFRLLEAAFKRIAGNPECAGNLRNVVEAGSKFLNALRRDFNPVPRLPGRPLSTQILPQ